MKKNFRIFKTDKTVNQNEEKIVDTVNKSIEIFYLKEQEKILTYREFLWTQFRITQKRWWLFQTLLLVGIGMILSSYPEEFYVQRGLGIASVLLLGLAGVRPCLITVCVRSIARISVSGLKIRMV